MMQQRDIDIAQQRWIEEHARTHLPALQVGCGMKPIAGTVNLDPNPDRWPWADVAADTHRLPFPAGYFHSVVSSHVLPSLRDPVGALREMARVLAPGGEMAHVVPDWRYAPRRCSTHHPFEFQHGGWYGPESFRPVLDVLDDVLGVVELAEFTDFRWSFKVRVVRL